MLFLLPQWILNNSIRKQWKWSKLVDNKQVYRKKCSRTMAFSHKDRKVVDCNTSAVGFAPDEFGMVIVFWSIRNETGEKLIFKDGGVSQRELERRFTYVV